VNKEGQNPMNYFNVVFVETTAPTIHNSQFFVIKVSVIESN